ncbi:MAG: hypothetical protein ACE5G1_15330, partial [bacterium]
MTRLLWTTLALMCLGLPFPGWAVDAGKTAEERLIGKWSEGNFSFALHQYFQARQTEFSNSSTGNPGQKSVGKAVLFSIAVPGAGQFYSGSPLKGIAFLVIEVAALSGYFHFQGRGNDIESSFEADADQLWNEDAYWNWMSQISQIPRSEMDALREFEHANFSHFLPENKNQQYYENIGKYNQFIMGWQDFREEILDTSTFTFAHYQSGRFAGQDLLTISAQRNAYTELRKDANDNFKKATNLATITFFNHVLSALDAGLTTRRFNRKVQASLRIRGSLYRNQIVPVLKMGIAW